jgi:Ca2+-transporting ATPase
LYFIGINFITVSGQVLIIFFGGSALSAMRLSGLQWAISLGLGAMSLLVAVVIRLIPDEFIRKLIPSSLKKSHMPQINISSDDRFEWNDALENVRNELTFLKKIRGGRLNALVFNLQHTQEILPIIRNSISGTSDSQVYAESQPSSSSPSSGRSRSGSNSAFGAAAVMAGVIAGSVAGWSPVGRDTENGSTEVS